MKSSSKNFALSHRVITKQCSLGIAHIPKASIVTSSLLAVLHNASMNSTQSATSIAIACDGVPLIPVPNDSSPCQHFKLTFKTGTRGNVTLLWTYSGWRVSINTTVKVLFVSYESKCASVSNADLQQPLVTTDILPWLISSVRRQAKWQTPMDATVSLLTTSHRK